MGSVRKGYNLLVHSKILTLRTIFSSSAVLSLLDEPEFADNLTLKAARDVKPLNDQYLAVFVFAAQSKADGTVLLDPISTTVVGIQRYSTNRLRSQGIYETADPSANPILSGTLRAHFRAKQEDLNERLTSISTAHHLRWTKDFPNGAGDLAIRPEFVIADPDLADLERLFSVQDPRPEDEVD
jgi:hypothetical protein